MQVSSPSIQLPGRVYADPFRSSHDPDQGALCQNLPAPHAGALGDVPGFASRFFYHLFHLLPSGSKFLFAGRILFLHSSHSRSPPRLCFLRATVTSRSGS